MLIDLHAKSSLSEGVKLSVAEVLDRSKEAGLDAVAFTESLSSAQCVDAINLGKEKNIKVFIGIEIPTDKGLILGFLPEVSDYYLNEEWRELTEYTTPAIEEVVEEFTSRGGAVIAARPYDLNIPFNMGDMIFSIPQLSGVEVFNPNVGELQNDFALEASKFLGLPTTAGSDPHDDAKGIGAYATLFLNDVSSQQELVEAIKNKSFWAVRIGGDRLPNTTMETSQRRSDDRRSSRGDNNRRSSGGRRDRNDNRKSSDKDSSDKGNSRRGRRSSNKDSDNSGGSSRRGRGRRSSNNRSKSRKNHSKSRR